jgi:hypothetical protein
MSNWRVLILLALFLSMLPTLAQRTINHGLHAVPAPAAVTIDGDLGEWDTSGTMLCTKDVALLADVESTRVAAMWDAKTLYLAFTWRDATPMFNKVDPVTMAGNGWRSDAAQLRFMIDNFVTHLDCWYYTTGQRPSISVHYGRYGTPDGGQPKVDRPQDPTALGAKQAFKASADGKGYVQELAVPWAVLTLDGKPPKQGADLRLGLELFWGNTDGDTWPRSRVTDNLYDGETQTDFFWTNTKAWGRLILEPAGRLTLPAPEWARPPAIEPQGPVPITFTLAKEQYVTIAIEDPAGNRVCSLLGGVKYPAGTHTVTWSGLDDRNRPLPAGTYRWTGLTRDRLDVRWKMSFYQPNTAIPWGNAAGTGAWGPDHGTLVAAAAGGGQVYLAGTFVEAGYALIAVDLDGTKRWSAKFNEAERVAYADGHVYAYTAEKSINFIGVAALGVMDIDAKTGAWLDVPGAGGKPVKRRALHDAKEAVAGFTADANGLYLAIRGADTVRAYDRKTLAPTRAYAVPGAGELYAPGDGTLLVAAKGGLLSVNLATGAVRALAADDLSAARGLTADARGTVYVAMPAPAHQVWVFTRRGTRYARTTLGKVGGRTQDGWYNPSEGFFNPTGVTVDARGRLWVVEQGFKPKRTSVWQQGRWVRDFIGDTGYGGGGIVNPLDPTMAFYNGMQFRIDLDKGTSTLRQIGLVLPKRAAEFHIAGAGDSSATGDHDATEFMMASRGRAYVLKCRGAREIYRERRDGRWTLCVYIDSDEKLAWIDRNDDGEMQDAEITRGAKTDNWGKNDYWGMRPSQTMDLYFANGATGLRLPCRGVTKGGTPLYDLPHFEAMAAECQNGIGLKDGTYNSGCQGERGEYYSEMRKAYPAGTATRTFWFRGENTGRWTYRLPAPGLVLYPFQAHGVADVPGIGEVVCWVSDFGERYLFTDDMLYVDQLFADGRALFDNWPDAPQKGFLANNMAPGQESFHGYFTRTRDGRYLLTNGFTDCRIFEVTGLPSLRRIGGEAVLTADGLARAAEIRRFRLTGGAAATQTTIARVAAPPTLDGRLTDWPAGDPLRVSVDAARGAQVRTAYDAEHLYVAWDVRDGSPLRNSASRVELAFKGGDAVDLMFRLPGAKLADLAVCAGDLRLLITELGGTAKAVLYRQIATTKQPFIFDAFEGAGRPNAVKMDEVRLAPEVRAAVTRGNDGYVVEAAIPWRLLGLTPAAGAEGRLDVGVLFGDPTGMQTALRAYWVNRDTNIVADIPSEARLQPANWGSFRLGE